MNRKFMQYLIGLIKDNANEALEMAKEQDNDFEKGRRLAYYEVLDTIKNQLEARDENLEFYGLNIDLDNIYLK